MEFSVRVDLKVTLAENSILMQIKPKMLVLQKYTGIKPNNSTCKPKPTPAQKRKNPALTLA